MCTDSDLPLCLIQYFSWKYTVSRAGSAHKDRGNKQVDVLPVSLGDSIMLNCTYNCSSGFLRGCWSKVSDQSGCDGVVTKKDFCTVSLQLSNVTAEDFQKNYTCYTVSTDDVQLLQTTERIVFLQLQGEQIYTNIDVALWNFEGNYLKLNVPLCIVLLSAQTTSLYPSRVTYKSKTNNGKIYSCCM